MLSALLLALTLAASFEAVPPADLSEGRLVAAPLHGSAVCALPAGAWQQIVDGDAVKGWVCTNGEVRLGLMPQGTSRAPMTDADAEKMLAELKATEDGPAARLGGDGGRGWGLGDALAVPAGEPGDWLRLHEPHGRDDATRCAAGVGEELSAGDLRPDGR